MCVEYINKLQSIMLSSRCDENASLYHYTSLNKFYRIIESRTLWMNPQQNHIDHEELKLGKNIILSQLNKLPESTKKKIKIGDIEQLIDRGFFRVTSSFCTEIDIPEMWNYYADNFNGAVIEFELNNIKDRIRNFEKGIAPKKYQISGFVEYDESYAVKNIRELLSEYQNYINERLCKCTNDHDLLLLTISYIMAYSLIIKHDYFSYENEFRICCFAIANKNNTNHPEPGPIIFNKESAILLSDSEKDYRILFPFEDQDIVSIYLIDRNFDQKKLRMINRLKYISGYDYSSRIKSIPFTDEVIEKFKPLPIQVK